MDSPFFSEQSSLRITYNLYIEAVCSPFNTVDIYTATGVSSSVVVVVVVGVLLTIAFFT